MPVTAAVRLAAQLNAAHRTATSPEVAARAVVADDAAHHVTDPDGVAGLDPLRASELDRAIAAVALLHPGDWVLALPRPGHLAPLRGPAALTSAALTAGAAVVGADGGVAWVPQRVGPAIQWRLYAAERPLPLVSPSEADRRLAEAIAAAARALADAGLVSGTRPADADAVLPACYSPRAQRSAQRALTLWVATDAALADPTGVLHSHGVGVRDAALREVHAAAAEALCAAVSWAG